MITIYLNEEGYVASPFKQDATIPMEITEEQFEAISEFTYNHNWRYVDGKFVLEVLNEELELRKRREKECFSYINRGELWYSRLTEAQVSELKAWYQSWLDVTKTKTIPTKPEWLY